MSCYVDTSVLIALCTNEAESARVENWYIHYKEELVSAVWCISEFASALSIKQRMKQITHDQSKQSWDQFQKLCGRDLNLLPLEPIEYYTAANMILKTNTGLRAGDALHLACAERHGAKHMATLDKTMALHAKTLKFKNIF